MTTDDELIKRKLNKAIALMAEVDQHISNKLFATAINRLYYSCFHATSAPLLSENLVAKTHAGLIRLLNQHLVLAGKFDVEHAKFFSKLMHERIEDDYGDFIIMNYDEIHEFVEPSKNYLNYILTLLNYS